MDLCRNEVRLFLLLSCLPFLPLFLLVVRFLKFSSFIFLVIHNSVSSLSQTAALPAPFPLSTLQISFPLSISPIRLIFRLIGIHDDAIFNLLLVDLLRRRRRRPRRPRWRPRRLMLLLLLLLLMLLLGDHEHGVMGRGRAGGALLRGLPVVRRTRGHCS